MRYVSVRTVDSGGGPVSNVRVTIEVHQFLAGGMTPAKYTSSDGTAEFALDVDDHAEITILANGNEKVGRGSIKASYTVLV